MGWLAELFRFVLRGVLLCAGLAAAFLAWGFFSVASLPNDAVRYRQLAASRADDPLFRIQEVAGVSRGNWRACMRDSECLAECARANIWGLADCPTEEDLVKARLREGELAFSEVPPGVVVGERFRVLAAAFARPEAVTPESIARRAPERSVGAAPRADDSPAVAELRQAGEAGVVTRGADLLPYLEASLDGAGFEVEPIGDHRRRNCQVGRVCFWEWSVSADEPGTLRLTTTINGFVSNEAEMAPVPMDTDTHTVVVSVSQRAPTGIFSESAAPGSGVQGSTDWNAVWQGVSALVASLGLIAAAFWHWRAPIKRRWSKLVAALQWRFARR